MKAARDQFSLFARTVRGLSLAELLIVVAILSILLAFASPTVFGLVVSHQRTQAVNEIASLVELARNEAMTRQCFTWLGFEQATDVEGKDELRAVVLAPEGGILNTTSVGGSVLIGNARPLSRTFRWTDLKLDALDRLARINGLSSTDEPTEPLADQRRQGFRTGQKQQNLLTITFTPQGYALLAPQPTLMTPYVRFIDIGLRPTRAGEDIDSPDQLGVVLNGFNGHTEILRR